MYVARHGQGYTRFEHVSHGIEHELVQFVPPKDPIKISRLTLAQPFQPHAPPFGRRLRRMGAREFAQRARRPISSPKWTRKPARIFARNAWEGEFGGRVAFADLARHARPP